MSGVVNVWSPLLSYPYYFGAFAVAPTVDTLGVTLGVLHEGYIYWNNVSKNAWIWSGTAWILLATSAATSALLVAVTDAANYYTGVNAETVLQEVGLSLATLTTANGLRLAEIGALQRSAVESYAPRENTTPNMTVIVDNLGILYNGVLTGVATSSNVAISAADPTNPRIDRLTVNYVTGGVVVTVGTPAAGPVAPAIPSGNFPVCQVRVNANVTTIANSNITDERVIYGRSWRGVTVYSTLNQDIPNNTNTPINFNAELRDAESSHDNATNNTRLTVPIGVHLVKLKGAIAFNNSSTAGYRQIHMTKGGATNVQGLGMSRITPVAAFDDKQSIESSVQTVVAGDYFELVAYQNSGGIVTALSNAFTCFFEMEFLP